MYKITWLVFDCEIKVDVALTGIYKRIDNSVQVYMFPCTRAGRNKIIVEVFMTCIASWGIFWKICGISEEEEKNYQFKVFDWLCLLYLLIISAIFGSFIQFYCVKTHAIYYSHIFPSRNYFSILSLEISLLSDIVCWMSA